MAKIQFERKIMEKESNQKISEIEDSMHLAKEKSKSDAEYYRVQRVAEANKLLLTPEYIEMKRIEKWTKIQSWSIIENWTKLRSGIKLKNWTDKNETS